MRSIKKNWAKYAAALLFLYVLVSVYHRDEFGSLNRYKTGEEYHRVSNPYSEGYVTRQITFRGVPEEQLYQLMKREFPEGKKWHQPYIERGECFVYDTYNNKTGQLIDTVTAVGHRVNGIMNVTIYRKRPMSALENGIASIREALNPDRRRG